MQESARHKELAKHRTAAVMKREQDKAAKGNTLDKMTDKVKEGPLLLLRRYYKSSVRLQVVTRHASGPRGTAVGKAPACTGALHCTPHPTPHCTSHPTPACTPHCTPACTPHPTPHCTSHPTPACTLTALLHPSLHPSPHPSLHSCLHPSLHPCSHPSPHPSLQPLLTPLTA